MIEFNCSKEECSYSKSVHEKHLGRNAKCPKCKTVTRITNDQPVAEREPELVPEDQDAGSILSDDVDKFSYKGDFPGMSESQFLERRRRGEGCEVCSNRDLTEDECDAFRLHEWERDEQKIVEYAITDEKIDILDELIDLGSFAFFEGTLVEIRLLTYNSSATDYALMFHALHKQFGVNSDMRKILDDRFMTRFIDLKSQILSLIHI